MFHLLLHALVPLFVARVFFRSSTATSPWWRAYLIMLATMLVDVDHLLATPIYDATRCSIGFHPLHQLIPVGIYVALCLAPKLRLIGIGLVIHMALDSIDCFYTNGIWYNS